MVLRKCRDSPPFPLFPSCFSVYQFYILILKETRSLLEQEVKLVDLVDSDVDYNMEGKLLLFVVPPYSDYQSLLLLLGFLRFIETLLSYK